VALVQRRPDGRWHVKIRIWLPRLDGRLDATDVMQYLRDTSAVMDVREVAFDPRFFDVPAQMLVDEGVPMVEFPQSLERMTPAVGLAYEMVKRGELAHDGDEAFSTQILNAVARYNERGFTVSKGKSRDRIDACVAMVMALAQACAVDRVDEPSFHILQL
jgi:phage terminase large subunit-like protein